MAIEKMIVTPNSAISSFALRTRWLCLASVAVVIALHALIDAPAARAQNFGEWSPAVMVDGDEFSPSLVEADGVTMLFFASNRASGGLKRSGPGRN